MRQLSHLIGNINVLKQMTINVHYVGLKCHQILLRKDGNTPIFILPKGFRRRNLASTQELLLRGTGIYPYYVCFMCSMSGYWTIQQKAAHHFPLNTILTYGPGLIIRFKLVICFLEEWLGVKRGITRLCFVWSYLVQMEFTGLRKEICFSCVQEQMAFNFPENRGNREKCQPNGYNFNTLKI